MDNRNFKDSAKLAAAYLGEHGFAVPHTRVLEALSRALGERNWSTLSAKLGSPGAAATDQSPSEAAHCATPWAPAQGPMTEQQYVAQGGNRCPFCGSFELEAEELEADGPDAWDTTSCGACGSTWKSAYRLAGYFSEKACHVASGPGEHEADGKLAAPGAPDRALRTQVVEDIVEDVRARAREYGFSVSGARQAQRLAQESSDTLGLDATDAELFEAASLLA